MGMRYLKPERVISRVSTELLGKITEKAEEDGVTISFLINGILEEAFKKWKKSN